MGYKNQGLAGCDRAFPNIWSTPAEALFPIPHFTKCLSSRAPYLATEWSLNSMTDHVAKLPHVSPRHLSPVASQSSLTAPTRERGKVCVQGLHAAEVGRCPRAGWRSGDRPRATLPTLLLLRLLEHAQKRRWGAPCGVHVGVANVHALVVPEDEEAMRRIRLLLKRGGGAHVKVFARAEGQSVRQCDSRMHRKTVPSREQPRGGLIEHARDGVGDGDLLQQSHRLARVIGHTVSLQKHRKALASELGTGQQVFALHEIVRHMGDILVDSGRLDRDARRGEPG